MKKLLYIISSLILVAACVNGPLEDFASPQQTGDSKVMIDFGVHINDASVATKSLAETPKLRNLMVAIFDETGYLLQYTYADLISSATENGPQANGEYKYRVAITQSDTTRIIHFIGNAPDKLAFGVEETVLAEISSSISNDTDFDDGIYWCRREIPKISGTNSGGMMALAEGDEPAPNTPIYQADSQTRAYFSNVGLIRNFSQIQLVSTSPDFTLDKYYVVGTPKKGLAAAYNYSTGEFMNYFKEVKDDKGEAVTITGNETAGYTYALGDAKTYEEIIDEGYDANVLPTAERFTLAEAEIESNWIDDGASAYVYECEKPLRAEDAVYIIAYGIYKGNPDVEGQPSDDKPYYYKIDLRNANGYFPIIRNFKYTINIAEVTRAGYDTIEKAAASTGSGDISTSLETISLAYISDGVASLEVEYVEKYIVTPASEDPNERITLDYTFLEHVGDGTPGDPKKMWVIVNTPGATGKAIAKVNGETYTVGEKIYIDDNPGELTITQTDLADEMMTQSLTIYAQYENEGATHILQRTVTYKVQRKRTMVVSLSPSEVPEDIGSQFDVNITLPAGLSKSIFPLEFLIESGSLSINPHKDQMPVRSGATLADNSGRSSFYFVKSFEYDDYNPESGAINTVNCHFKTIKFDGKTHIYAANPYFETVYDYEGTVSDEDANGKSVYLNTYDAYEFPLLSFSKEPVVGLGENIDIDFTFKMEKVPDDGVVYVALGNLEPAPQEQQLVYHELKNGKNVYKFYPEEDQLSATFKLQTAHFDGVLSVDLSATRFIPASKSVKRSWYQFNGMFEKGYLTNLTEDVKYSFYLDPNYYYDGMVIAVEMKGLSFKPNSLPDDWTENWHELGNDIYVYEFKPSGPLDSWVEIALVPQIQNVNETCSITLQSRGYETQTSTIKVAKTITIKPSAIIDLGTNNVNTLRSISIENGGAVTYTEYTIGTQRQNYRTYYTIQFTDLEFKGVDIDDDTEVTIVTSYGTNGTERRTYTTIGALRGN